MNKDNYIPRNELRKYILDIVKNDKYNSVPAGIILKKIIEIDQYYSAHKQIVYDYIFSLIDDGELFQQNDSGKISINKQHYTFKGSEREGIIAINSAGNGFITVDDTKYFIYRTNTKNAQNGDLVSFHEISRAEKDNEAIVTKIINHEKKCYVCWVNEAKNLVPDDIRCNLEFKLTDNSKVTPNEKILIKVTEYKDNVAFCSLISVIGNKDDIGVDVLSIVLDANIEPDFDSELLKEAEAKTIEVDEKQKSLRKDLTHLNIITIDPATSKDFDDAYYLETTKTGYKLYVCIADVSHFVQLNSDLGIEALKRTSSIYLIDRVIPMLPHALSNGICSINPNEIRFSLTCEMDLNKEGVITNTKLYPSIIKSKRRFSYDEVNDFFNNKNELKNDTKEIKDMLLLSKQLHIILRELKIRLGYINLSSNEPNIIVNNQNKIIDIVKKPSGTAQEMIEDFMVCANESVTKYAVEKKYPFIYRIHETPVEEKIKDFILEAKSISFLTPEVSFPITSKILSKWLVINKENENFDIASIMLLRCMAKAKYAIENVGHFGLGLKYYTHFTSPIRRFADFLIHHIFWVFDFDKESYSDEYKDLLNNKLLEYCKDCNEKEIIIQHLERDVNNMKFAEFLEDKIFSTYTATIYVVASFGFFVQLNNTIQGLVSIKTLEGNYIYNEKNGTLSSEDNKIVYSLGKKVNVQLIYTNKETRRIEFKII